ncbi:hypothetical protein EZS27_019971 [termite gut metagenome]|uniref:Outer membrane protein beta-barrel domain-containing protein n=1 Tax=termite gut metagenome TaxID=433724 RepID=A0A5J4RCD5_9ZZZZ
MVKRIFSFSILLISLFLSACVLLQAQNAQPDTKNNDAEKIPLYNGVYVGADIYGIGNQLFGSDFFTTEISVDVNLKRRFFPVVELGYGKTDVLGELGTHYKAAAPYFRIGMNYNSSYKKNRESHWYVGVRYGVSGFSYDVEQLSMKDPIWNETVGNNPALKDEIWGGGSLPYEHPGLKANVQWYELVFGVRVQVYKNFMIGWSVRSKTSLSASISEYGSPWYIPGYGIYGSSKLALTYSLIYKLPFQK